MRKLLLASFLSLSFFLDAQNFEMPSAKALKKNKIHSLEIGTIQDSVHSPFAWYRFDDKGRVVYEKTKHSFEVKPYYTVYTYDKKGRLSTTINRFEDGKFFSRIDYTWLKDSIRIQSFHNDMNDSEAVTLKYWLDPRNTVLRMISYDTFGKERSDMGGLFNRKGKLIGSYDSSAQTRTRNEYVFRKYRQISRYDEKGQLINVTTLQCDTAGYFIALIDSVPANKTATHYTLVRSNASGLVVSRNGIALTREEQSVWSTKYGQYHYNDPLIGAGPGAVNPPCFPVTPSYDETGLIRSIIVNNSCTPNDAVYPYTIFYWYSQ